MWHKLKRKIANFFGWATALTVGGIGLLLLVVLVVGVPLGLLLLGVAAVIWALN